MGRVGVDGETRRQRRSQYDGGFERLCLVVTEPGCGESRACLVPGGRKVCLVCICEALAGRGFGRSRLVSQRL